MVIGVEGNVHVGKTTYIRNQYKNFEIVSETEFNNSLSDYDRQIYYIDSEIIKKKRVLTNKKNIILDRTILSTIVYTVASNVFDAYEVSKLMNYLREKIIKDEIILPNFIDYIVYPYELINLNQQIIGKKKNTQYSLVDYKYYLSYSMFFSNLISKNSCVINSFSDYRQILKCTCYNIDEELKKNNILKMFNVCEKIVLDGAPAIGKSTIGKIQTKYDYVEELKYKPYTLKDYSNQVESIIYRINLLNRNNVLIDTSFLMGITNLFYRDFASKDIKLKVIDEIMKKTSMLLYSTKIVYLTLSKSKLYFRKNNDTKKRRNHFDNNMKYLDNEINFYEQIHLRLGEKSNIYFIDADDSVENIISKINLLEHKPLFLIDLFYTMKELIKEGKI